MEGDTGGVLRHRQPGVLLHRRQLFHQERIHLHGPPPHADDIDVAREMPEEDELVQRREELLLGEVAGGAEDDHGERHGLVQVWLTYGVEVEVKTYATLYFSSVTPHKNYTG